MDKLSIAAVLLVVALAAGYLYASGALNVLQPSAQPSAELPESSDFFPSVDDAALYKALADNGVQGAVVEIQQGRVLVSLQVPAGADARKTAFLAIGAAGALAPTGSKIIVEARQGSGKRTFTANSGDVKELLEGKINEQEFEARVSEN